MWRISLDYFKPNKRFTKWVLAGDTNPFLARARFRFFDFFVKMWRLKAF